MRAFRIVLLTFLLGLLAAAHVYGCTCEETDLPYCEQVSRADTVFIGTVKQIKKVDEARSFGESLIQFEVEQVYKGAPPQMVDVSYIFGTSCSWNDFKVGERWIVYGHRRSPAEGLSIPFCTGSHAIGETFADKFLNDFREGRNGESVRGKLMSYGEGPIANAPVVISREQETFTGTSDSDGLFEIQVPGPGKYGVRIAVPFTALLTSLNPAFSVRSPVIEGSRSVWEYETNVPKGLCSYGRMDFTKVDLKATASISGRLIDAEGRPIRRGFVYLAKWEIDEKSTLERLDFQSTNREGNFIFDGLREGRYVVIFSPQNFPEKDRPYIRSYLPGVSKFSDAFVVELAQGKVIDLPDFRLPKKLPTRAVELEIVMPDGQPVLKEHPNAGMDQLPWISIHRSNGDYVEHADAKRSGAGKYSFDVYQGFSYVIGVQITGRDDRLWNGFVILPAGKTSERLKVVLGPKNGEASDFVKRLNTPL